MLFVTRYLKRPEIFILYRDTLLHFLILLEPTVRDKKIIEEECHNFLIDVLIENRQCE